MDRRRRPRSNRCGGGGNGGYSWNIILSYCARVDEPRRRLPQMEDVVQRMRAVGVTPDCYSYTSLVAVCLASHAHAASRSSSSCCARWTTTECAPMQPSSTPSSAVTRGPSSTSGDGEGGGGDGWWRRIQRPETVTRANKSSTSALGSELFVFGSALCAFGSALPGLGQNITPAPRISRRPEKGYD